MSKPLLISPITLRETTAKNRIMISPMATYSAVDGLANDWHLGHIARLAMGGAGIVCIEATAVTPEGRITNGDTGLWSTAHVAPMKKLADFIRSWGGIPAIQLGHAGRKGAMQRPWHGNGAITPADIARGDRIWSIVAPTSDPMAPGHLVPSALSVADIARLKQAWADAAKRALDAGFDIIEIHNAHGYLVHQFLSPLSNKRNDAYGGDLQGRMRFPVELAAAVRAVVPMSKPLFLRISAVDGLDGGWTIEDSVTYARALKDVGIDVIACSSGGLTGSATAARVKRTWGYNVPYAAKVRKEAEIATVAVGLIIEPEHAERILQAGEADIIAIGREALVNPSWPHMAELALGRPAMEQLGDLPEKYGWWLKLREKQMQDIRAEDARAAGR
ncbi:MAG TPA: NADH:flavin oxidoreductase/NADH oxidase [Hyphomicrobiaceae bacterium]|nr:NADH:flavin oxidoreductase/NADH oxidase [Hyphomicrobiaceae bacterium]